MAVFIIKRPPMLTSSAEIASFMPETMITALTMLLPSAFENLLINGCSENDGKKIRCEKNGCKNNEEKCA